MSNLHVTVEQGTLKGCTLTTDHGYSYSGFLGIPFAKPPVGELRFRDPQYPEKWEGVRDASIEGNDGPQLDTIFMKGLKGNEDSLFLNVYVPKTPSKDSKLPVMVWIHGGAFTMGSGSRELYGPDYLIQADVIVVTINYRLGPFGFLCLNTAEVPGNAGLKDQSFALQWVHKNIHAFGGDDANITIFGESAGGASVHFQVLSPMSKGLFNKAVLQSGASTCSWAVQKTPEQNAFEVAAKLGFDSTDKAAVLKFLRQASVEDLVNVTTRPLAPTESNTFAPIVEQTFAGVDGFLTVDPVELMTTGNYNRVPCIQGFTSQEGVLFLVKQYRPIADLTTVKKFSDINVDIALVLKKNLPKPLDDETAAKMAKKIEQFYFPNDENVLDNFIDLMSDVMFIQDIDQSIKLHSKRDTVYCYKFNYNGGMNLFKLLTEYPYKGASHGDEITYLFKPNMGKLPEGIPEPKITELDIVIVKRLVELWTNFAKYGNPTPKLSDAITTQWKPIGEDDYCCLEIDDGLRMISDPFAERIKFWKNLMK